MMKMFEQFKNEEEIKKICKKYKIENYTINPDESIDVDGDVDLSHRKLSKIPLNFNKVSGNFWIHNNNNLTSLEGCPKEVGKWFSCSDNNLTSLEGCPKFVDGRFSCSNNKLTSLEGCPNIIYSDFECAYNIFTLFTLKDFPMKIDGYLNICGNPISIIDSSIEVGGDVYINRTNFDNKIKELSQEKLRILFEHGIDYDIFRKDGSINDSRLERMFKDFNL